MSATKDGGAAFPQLELAAGERDGHGDAIEVYTVATGGMKLRDYFAAKAMQAMLSRPEVQVENLNDSFQSLLRAVSEMSYAGADAMLKARQQNGGEHER